VFEDNTRVTEYTLAPPGNGNRSMPLGSLLVEEVVVGVMVLVVGVRV
jgi:hypothetical protein